MIAVLASLLVLTALVGILRAKHPVPRPAFASAARIVAPLALPEPPPPPPAPPPPPEPPRADRALNRTGPTMIAAGVLYVPDSFSSKDGSYDLVVHFHGNAQLVTESISLAGLNALVLVINVGIGSGVYDSRYMVPALFDVELDRVRQAMEARGLEGARLNRLALSAWSAGYGAIARILDLEGAFARTDAVLLLDAPHTSLLDPRSRTPDLVRIEPFLRFARAAAKGEKLMAITHSEIGAHRHATTTETTDAILRDVRVHRERKADWPPHADGPIARGVMSTPRWLEQWSEARLGSLSVRGYRGVTEDDHIAHIAQMSVTVLPELIAFWKANGALL
ncbi:hypothetical protein [Polyangium aurulentum]|uniref:hypothetical protein n=1 Tax=Polyangium aurulentum TaxID=2567896 RepID=UPI0010AEC4B2|nr:hypothetical protein [Polyangium aurulentum]UQA56237.1 hypothetical protein E8A73_033710 [Polyangium aurulentum]